MPAQPCLVCCRRFSLGVIIFQLLAGADRPFVSSEEVHSLPTESEGESMLAMLIATAPMVRWPAHLQSCYEREAPELMALVEALLCRLPGDRAGMEQVCMCGGGGSIPCYNSRLALSEHYFL